MKWMCQTQSLGRFEKFRKAAVSFVVSFCLSVHMEVNIQLTVYAHCRFAQLSTDSQWCTFRQTAATFPVQLHTTPLRTVVATSVPTVHRSSAVRHGLSTAPSVPKVHRSSAVRHGLPAASSSSSRRAAVPAAYRSRLYQMLDNRP